MQNLTIAGIKLSFYENVEPHGYVFRNLNNDEAVFSISPSDSDDRLSGILITADGKSFSLEKCIRNSVWIEYDNDSLVDETDDVISALGEKVKSNSKLFEQVINLLCFDI